MGCTPSRSSAPSAAVQKKKSIVAGCGVDIVRYRAELVFYHKREAERYGSRASNGTIIESKEIGERKKGRRGWRKKIAEGRKMEEATRKEGVEGDDYFSFNPH